MPICMMMPAGARLLGRWLSRTFSANTSQMISAIFPKTFSPPAFHIIIPLFPLFLLLNVVVVCRLLLVDASPTREQQMLRKRLLQEHPDLFPTEADLNTYLSSMNRLSVIQQQLNSFINQQQQGTEADDDWSSPSSANFESLSASTLARRPDQLPYLFEGDIVLTNEQVQELLKEAEAQLALAKRCHSSGAKDCQRTGEQVQQVRAKRTLTSVLSQRWTLPVPFVVNRGVNRTSVLLGISNWERSTCLRFREFSQLAVGGSGLQFIAGFGCYSTVGRVNGRSQQVSIGNGCQNPFVVSHEIAHAMGFFHEQSRWDRDSFVQIQTRNVLAGFLNQFIRLAQSSVTSYGVRYDLGSVMHYDAFGFARSGLMSMLTRDPNYQQTIGQRFQLSFNDVKKMNFAYCNGTCRTRLPCFRSGYTDPTSCARCRCPDGLAGQLCDRVDNTGVRCGELILRTSGSDQSLGQRGAGDCNFLIIAPANSKVIISMDTIQFRGAEPCQPQSYVEIRYKGDLGSVGARFCFSTQRRVFISEAAEVLVLYRSASNQNAFSLRYRTGAGFGRRRRSTQLSTEMLGGGSLIGSSRGKGEAKCRAQQKCSPTHRLRCRRRKMLMMKNWRRN